MFDSWRVVANSALRNAWAPGGADRASKRIAQSDAQFQAARHARDPET